MRKGIVTVAFLAPFALAGCVDSGSPDMGVNPAVSTQTAAAAFESICLASKPDFATAPALMKARGFVAAPDKEGYVWHSSQRMAVEVSKLSNGMPACVIRAVVPQAEQPAVSLVAMYGPMRQSPVSGLFYFEGKHGQVFFGPPYPSRGGDTQSFEIGIIPGI